MRKPILIAAVLAALVLPAAARTAKKAKETPCCFDHDGYNGHCVVSPGEGETCASILEYLNTPNTVGKAYCGGSNLRGGWTKVVCAKPASR